MSETMPVAPESNAIEPLAFSGLLNFRGVASSVAPSASVYEVKSAPVPYVIFPNSIPVTELVMLNIMLLMSASLMVLLPLPSTLTPLLLYTTSVPLPTTSNVTPALRSAKVAVLSVPLSLYARLTALLLSVLSPLPAVSKILPSIAAL